MSNIVPRRMHARTALIDTAAVMALHQASDQFHLPAVAFFADRPKGWDWFCLRVTSHEAFTATRYSDGLRLALSNYDFLRSSPFRLIDFCEDDENGARSLVQRHSDQDYSFHDALCAVVMKRIGIPNIFTFDSHFWTMGLGFTVLPGPT